jgi:hypothetical protein
MDHMIKAEVAYLSRRRDSLKVLELTLWPGYGADAATAHTLLEIALTDASRPVVVDATGTWWRIPRKRLHSVMVWQCDEDALPGPA